MATVHMSEADVARNLHAVLARVKAGVDVIIDQDHRPVAVLSRPVVVGRMISDVIAALKERGSHQIMGDDFARDIEDGIRLQRQPWTLHPGSSP